MFRMQAASLYLCSQWGDFLLYGISYLMTVDELEFYDEIECEDLFDGNDPRERIMIFQLPD